MRLAWSPRSIDSWITIELERCLVHLRVLIGELEAMPEGLGSGLVVGASSWAAWLGASGSTTTAPALALTESFLMGASSLPSQVGFEERTGSGGLPTSSSNWHLVVKHMA